MEKSSPNNFTRIRPPSVAGRFYPSHPAELRRVIEDFLNRVAPHDAAAPKAVIAPHAGYIYSGPIAASAYTRFASASDVITRVVLIGPSHYVPFEGLAASSADAFTTPLGSVPVDKNAVRRVCSLPQVKILDEAHVNEHSLEVHLPFLQVALRNFEIVPLVVGDASEQDVAEAINMLWNGPGTRFVISSDLSHFHDYTRARELDIFTSHAIEQLRFRDVGQEHACGQIPIRGLLRAAQHHGLSARTVDLRNSGDTAGGRDEVVGYGAFVFEGTG